jgi:hypothetical protein
VQFWVLASLDSEGVGVKKTRPVLVTIIALLQVVAILIVPPAFLRSVSWVFLLVLAPVFVLMGWALYALRPLGRTLTIFLQGMNIIVRVLITLSKVVPSKAPGTPADIPLLVSSLVSILVSSLILFYMDQPEMQLLFES